MTFAAKPPDELLEELRSLQAEVSHLKADLLEKEALCLELAKKEQSYKDLFDFAADAILVGSPQGDIIAANHSASLLTGYASTELLGMNISRFFSEPERARTPLRYDLLKAGKVIHHERALIRKDGTTVMVGMNSKMMPDGTYHTFMRDISERIQGARALKEREAALSSILRAAPIGIGVTKNRMITWVGKNLLNMLDYSTEELLGKSARMLYESDVEYERVGKKKYQEIAEGKIGVVETRWVLKNGKVVDILLSSTPLDSSDHSLGITFTALDITERKAAEEKQRQSALIESEFIATASHELRTPLTVALGYLELLLEKEGLTRQQEQEFLTCIHEKARVLEKLIDELLDIGRIESGRMICIERTLVRVADVVESVVRPFHRETSRHLFSCTFRDADFELFIDQGKFVQVMENLIGNAVKFSTKGGNIAIHGEVVDDCFQFSVSDEGIGVSAEQKEHIFEKFYRADSSNTAVRGLGIGLYLVKNIIEAHKGKIWVESRPGKGTQFLFKLPLAFNLLDGEIEHL
jgi:PAS domain S-box-containing protein